MTMMTNSKLSQHNQFSDTFWEPVPELSRKLQLEHHQCIRLLKAVHGLVNAPRRCCHRVATDLRNMKGEESVMEPTFRDENGVIHALCLVYVDDFMLKYSDCPFGKHMFVCTKGESGSHECSNSVAHKSLKPTINTLEHGVDSRSASQNT